MQGALFEKLLQGLMAFHQEADQKQGCQGVDVNFRLLLISVTRREHRFNNRELLQFEESARIPRAAFDEWTAGARIPCWHLSLAREIP